MQFYLHLNIDFFYFVYFIYLLGLSFEVRPQKIFCLQSSIIKTLEQCQAAAIFLNLPFERTGAWTGNNQLGGCQSYSGEVGFNSALHVGDTNTVLTGIRAICVKGEDIEHICTYNDHNYFSVSGIIIRFATL